MGLRKTQVVSFAAPRRFFVSLVNATAFWNSRYHGNAGDDGFLVEMDVWTECESVERRPHATSLA